MKTSLKTKETPLQSLIDSVKINCEFSTEKEALKLIIEERTGNEFNIFDYSIDKVIRRGNDWAQFVNIIGYNVYKTGEKLFEAVMWCVTDDFAEPHYDIKDKDLTKYFSDESITLYNNKGKVRITSELIDSLTFTEEELQSAAKQAQEAGYYSGGEFTHEDFIFDEDAIQDIECEVANKLDDEIAKDWEYLKLNSPLDIGYGFTESWEEYEYEEDEDTDYPPESYVESSREGVWFTHATQEMVIKKLLNI